MEVQLQTAHRAGQVGQSDPTGAVLQFRIPVIVKADIEQARDLVRRPAREPAGIQQAAGDVLLHCPLTVFALIYQLGVHRLDLTGDVAAEVFLHTDFFHRQAAEHRKAARQRQHPDARRRDGPVQPHQHQHAPCHQHQQKPAGQHPQRRGAVQQDIRPQLGRCQQRKGQAEPAEHRQQQAAPAGGAQRPGKQFQHSHHRKVQQQDAAQLPEAGDGEIRRRLRGEGPLPQRRGELSRLQPKKQRVDGAQCARHQVPGGDGQPGCGSQRPLQAGSGDRRARAAQPAACQAEQPCPHRQRENPVDNGVNVNAGQVQPAQRPVGQRGEGGVHPGQLAPGDQADGHRRHNAEHTAQHLFAAGAAGFAQPCRNPVENRADAQQKVPPGQRGDAHQQIQRRPDTAAPRCQHAGAGHRPVDRGGVPGQQLQQLQSRRRAQAVHRKGQALRQPAHRPETAFRRGEAFLCPGKQGAPRQIQHRKRRDGPAAGFRIGKQQITGVKIGQQVHGRRGGQIAAPRPPGRFWCRQGAGREVARPLCGRKGYT